MVTKMVTKTMKEKTVVGIDLAGTQGRPTGICIIRNKEIETFIVYGDEEILRMIREVEPSVIAIDAPLSLPEERKTLGKRLKAHLRECDRELLKRKIKVFPPTLGPMKKLTERGISLKKKLEEEGYEVIEVYPGGAQDVWKIPRKTKGKEKLRKGLERLGVKVEEGVSDHELDAITSAIVGRLYLEGRFELYGTKENGIVMPKKGDVSKIF